MNLARGLKKIHHMKVMVKPIVVGALRTVPKGMQWRLEELKIRRTETIQTQAM